MIVAPAPKRRAILKGAAWSTPVIAAAIGAPAASASGSVDVAIPNDQANFYWVPSAGADFSTLIAHSGDKQVEYSTQISYTDFGAWPVPPLRGHLQLRITFDAPVTLQSIPRSWTLMAPSSGMGPANTFMFHASPSPSGHNLSAKFVPLTAGQVTALSSMSLIDGGAATWAQESAVATADFSP